MMRVAPSAAAFVHRRACDLYLFRWSCVLCSLGHPHDPCRLSQPGGIDCALLGQFVGAEKKKKHEETKPKSYFSVRELHLCIQVSFFWRTHNNDKQNKKQPPLYCSQDLSATTQNVQASSHQRPRCGHVVLRLGRGKLRPRLHNNVQAYHMSNHDMQAHT